MKELCGTKREGETIVRFFNWSFYSQSNVLDLSTWANYIRESSGDTLFIHDEVYLKSGGHLEKVPDDTTIYYTKEKSFYL